jgi:hypothetical protein
VDVNLEIDELVLDCDFNPGKIADELLMATRGALTPDAANQLSRAVLTAVTERGGPAGPGRDGRRL